MPDFPMILAWAVPFFILAVAIEWGGVARKKLHGRYETRDAAASLSMGVGNLISDITMGFLSLAVLFWVWQYRLFDWGFGFLAILAALVAQDFVYYWKHRLAHRIRWFWSAHVVHHSSEHYNLSTALRQPWNNHITGHVFISAPLVLLGVHPLLLGFVAAINLLYQFWIHTEAIDKMPAWFEAIFNTPSHHRVHHATNPRYLDSNYAGILIIWDKLFGTFVPELETEATSYGVVKPINTYNPIKIAFAEMINIFKDASQSGQHLSTWQRLCYIFAPPGYSHDGSRMTSEDIKRDYLAQYPHQLGSPGLPSKLLETSSRVNASKAS